MPMSGNDYFLMFKELGGDACRSAKMLEQILREFNPDTLQEKMAELHAIEHAADDKKHTLMENLVKEFITPIEREDILAIANELDDVIDAIEDILIKIYMFNILSIKPEALSFVQIIVRCCDELYKMLEEFHNYKKSRTIHDSIVELNRMEELGDDLYVKSMRSLYESGGNPIEIMAWSAVYSKMESCCDACEHNANLVEEVIMKNV